MKLNPHSKYLRFIFFFLLILWGIIGIFDFVNFYFDWNKPLINHQFDPFLNSLNLRGKEELPGKMKEEVRILILGDSVTYGLHVSSKMAWPYQMQAHLRKNGVAATSMNAGKPGFLSEQMFFSYENLIKKGQKPDIVILYGSGNWLASFDRSEPYFYNEAVVFLTNLFPNFPNDLILKRERKEKKSLSNEKFFNFPLFIKMHEYLSPFFALIVKRTSAFNEQKNEFLKKEKDNEGLKSISIENETIYIAKIISLAKETNTPILIVKPFYIFSYKNFTEKMWNIFALTLRSHFSTLPAIRDRITEANSLYAAFKDHAYIIDPTEEILTMIHPESDIEDIGRIMENDYVHYRATGNSIVGKIIGDRLLSLGLVKQVSNGEWFHPKENVIDKQLNYLRYREIRLDYQNYRMYLSCFAMVLIVSLFLHGANFLLTVSSTIVLFVYLSQKQYMEDIVLSLQVLSGFVFSYSFFKYFIFEKFIPKKKYLDLLVFFILISTLLFINVNLLSQKLSKMSNSSEILTILKENIAWSDYYQFFMKQMDYYETFNWDELSDAVYKYKNPIPVTLIIALSSYSEAPFLFTPAIPAIPAFFSSVFKFDSVEIFFLLASIPYIVLYLFYLKMINTVFISKLKYLLYPIGLFFIKQEIDFLFPIVFLIVTLTSLGIYSIYSPIKKYRVTRYLSALAFWPLCYLVIPETLLLLGLVCIYFFLMEFYQNSFSLWSSMQNTFLWICVLFIPKLFILMLPSSKVNLDYMIHYNLLPKTFHLHSVYSFLAALIVLLFVHANRERLKFIKRKILQASKQAF